MKLKRWLDKLENTQQLAEELVAELDALHGQVIYLYGDLGMGKTTLVRLMLQSLGYTERIKSPTYGLLESYEIGELQILHLDLYRLEDPEELEYLGLRDLHSEQSLLLIEWPENGIGALPLADLSISLSGNMQQRVAVLELMNLKTPLNQRLLLNDKVN